MIYWNLVRRILIDSKHLQKENKAAGKSVLTVRQAKNEGRANIDERSRLNGFNCC